MPATGAHELASILVIDIAMFIVSTSLRLGIRVQYALVATGINVICRHGSLIAISFKRHIHAVEVKRRNVEVEIGVVHNAVGLTTRSATDVVDNTVVLIYLPLGQRLCACIAMVVACEVEIDSCLLNRIRQFGKVLLATASGIGVIDGNMGDQNLPIAARCGCILNQPLLELIELGLVTRKVEHRDVDIAILHGVPVTRKVESLFCKSRTVTIVVCFMVAYDMQHVLVGNAIERKELEGVGPLVVVAYVIHCIAQLDSEIIPTILDM